MNAQSISVKVATRYLAQQSSPQTNQYAFAYHITITNDGQEAAQLISRHWIITDAYESVQEVQGEGVIGEQPLIEPGGSYQYTSGVVLKTEVGTMAGTYQMLSPSGIAFDAEIPVFLLATPNAVH